ncbi:MAG: winged helix-turn-helix transcriptional regulator [Actinomycetia bacterium]|nr:winged helix-turn-helix transcriptional regulator [Actinomycetes bacterium]MCP4087745.1 winged helix-turn-helix transcriptional regulator [Actinomycetes bacterium]
MSTPPADVPFETGQGSPAQRLTSAWFDLDQSGITEYVYGPEPLDATQTRILTLICEVGSAPVSELRGRLQVDPSTTSRAVSRLVVAGLAERRRHMADRRVVLVAPTAAGQARHDDARHRTEALMTAALDGLSEVERDPLIRNVELFVEQARKYLSMAETSG